MSNTKSAAYPSLVDELRSQVSEKLTPQEVEYYRGGIPEQAARDDGAEVESASVLDEVIRLGTIALPFVVAKQVPGYGPLRLRYLLDSGYELAKYVSELDTALVDAAGAGAAKTTNLRGSRALRRTALRALKNLAGRRDEDRARVRAVAKGKEKPDERSRSLQSIADELAAVLAKVPPRVAADAGVTDELMKGLRSNATAVLSSHKEAQGTRGSIASLYDEMNVLDGRIRHELRLLLGAFRDARAETSSIPKLSSKLIQRSGKKKKKADAPGAGGEGQGPSGAGSTSNSGTPG